MDENALAELEKFINSKKAHKLINKVTSIRDPLFEVKLNPDGTITHKVSTNEKLQAREFKDLSTYEKWVNKHLKDY